MKTVDAFRINFQRIFAEYESAAKGNNQTTLAMAAGLKQGQISVWLKGGYLPTLENLRALADVLGRKMDDFVRDPDQSTHPRPAERGPRNRIAAILPELSEECLGAVIEVIASERPEILQEDPKDGPKKNR